MARYYLIGGKDDDLKSNFIESQLVNLIKKEKPYMLYFSTGMKDDLRSINHFLSTFEGLNINIKVIKLIKENVDIDKLDEEFNKADIVYIGGGNTDFINKTFKNLSIDKLFFKYSDCNKVYAGISAGAIMYCNSGMGDSYSYKDHDRIYNFKMVNGLGLLDTYVCPHYQKDDLYIYNDEIKDKDIAYALEDDTALLLDNDNKIVYKANKRHSVYQFKKGLMESLY